MGTGTQMIFNHRETRSKVQEKEWAGKCVCNYCGLDLQTARPLPGEAHVYLYDFRTLSGAWAVGCRLHYLMYRQSDVLGTGRGQEYKRNDEGRFIKTRG